MLTVVPKVSAARYGAVRFAPRDRTRHRVAVWRQSAEAGRRVAGEPW